MEQIQKDPLTFKGLKQRDKSIPMLKGSSMRMQPPVKFTALNVHPTPILP
ncbi:hypothetical protein EVA_14426 [gut metagenome]|uniref:Uncharacterized protein n=1 Tax=gut metagenome TaxID=749906 RepID=J9G6P3_9ZZZZ